jgi:hypothetical protein
MTARRRSGPTSRRNATASTENLLWRSAGARPAQVEVHLTPEGGLTLRHHETGSTLRSAWGEDDFEATLEIQPEHLLALTVLLLQAGFGGQRDALEQLRLYCERHGVPHRVAVWT